MEPADEIPDTRSSAPCDRRPERVSAAELDAEFERFFIAHHDAILRALEAATGDHEIAVDATQDAFIRAHTRWSLIRTYEAPDIWVRRVAINVSRDRMRSERRRRNREATHDASAQLSTADQFDADTNVRALLDQLPQRQQAKSRGCSMSTIAASTTSLDSSI